MTYEEDVPEKDCVKYSVCMNTVDIKINNAVANILVQPVYLDNVDGEGVCSEFDQWWHLQVNMDNEDYNAL
jgi:hypothetical protein